MIDVSPFMLQAFRDEYIKIANALTDIGMSSITGGGKPNIGGSIAQAAANLVSKAAPMANAVKKPGYASSIFKGAEDNLFLAGLRQAQAVYMGKEADVGSFAAGARRALASHAANATTATGKALGAGIQSSAKPLAQLSHGTAAAVRPGGMGAALKKLPVGQGHEQALGEFRRVSAGHHANALNPWD
jgi:hypothetical protein